MKMRNLVISLKDAAFRRHSIFHSTLIICIIFFLGSAFYTFDYKENGLIWATTRRLHLSHSSSSSSCQNQWKPFGREPLPKAIVRRTSNFEMHSLWGSPGSLSRKGKTSMPENLLAIAVGIKQKEVVNKIVEKFILDDFSVILFHYDGFVDEWSGFEWSRKALHVAAINQTKWWFAKRFLHPDIVSDYKFIFLWDEDLGVEHFLPRRYLSIVKKEGLEISQPALDSAKSQVHHHITARSRKGDVHRRMYKFRGSGRCYENSTAPPCTGWVEMMAPVFSRAAWRCVWNMIQNDLIHAWGLDMKLGYCVQGDRSRNVGVVDSEFIVHKGIPTLGGSNDKRENLETVVNGTTGLKESPTAVTSLPGSPASKERTAVRYRAFEELEIFKKRWESAVAEDKGWYDPYPEKLNQL